MGLAQVDGTAVDRERILREIRTRFIATEKSASIRMRDLSGYARSRSSGYPIEFALRGFDRQPLRELANTIVAQMSRDPRLTDVWAGPRPVPTYAVDIDRAKVARLGLALPDVSASLQAVFGSVQAGNLQVVGREWPILLKIDPAGRSEVERLVQSHLRTAKGDWISLSEVAAVHLESEPAYLERLNIYPVIVITAGLGGDLSLAEARFVCERLVTDAIRERGRAANSLRWLRPMPPAKAPARSGGAPTGLAACRPWASASWSRASGSGKWPGSASRRSSRSGSGSDRRRDGSARQSGEDDLARGPHGPPLPFVTSTDGIRL